MYSVFYVCKASGNTTHSLGSFILHAEAGWYEGHDESEEHKLLSIVTEDTGILYFYYMWFEESIIRSNKCHRKAFSILSYSLMAKCGLFECYWLRGVLFSTLSSLSPLTRFYIISLFGVDGVSLESWKREKISFKTYCCGKNEKLMRIVRYEVSLIFRCCFQDIVEVYK